MFKRGITSWTVEPPRVKPKVANPLQKYATAAEGEVRQNALLPGVCAVINMIDE